MSWSTSIASGFGPTNNLDFSKICRTLSFNHRSSLIFVHKQCTFIIWSDKTNRSSMYIKNFTHSVPGWECPSWSEWPLQVWRRSTSQPRWMQAAQTSGKSTPAACTCETASRMDEVFHQHYKISRQQLLPQLTYLFLKQLVTSSPLLMWNSQFSFLPLCWPP